MPLMPGKKNIGNNIAMEENSGKSKKQALAMALSVARKPKKKMAQGGKVEESASNEPRPMPAQAAASAPEVARNSAKKPMAESSWTDRPEMRQSAKGMKTTPIKHPRMVKSDAISARLLAEEDDLQRLAKGGMINDAISMDKAEQDEEQHPAGLESDNDEMKPSEEEIMSNHPKMLAEGGDYDEYGYPKDKSKLKPLYNAKGGMIDAEENTAGNPVSRPDKGWGAVIVKADGGMIEDEEMDEHHASIAAAIMAKRDKALRMAEGGQVDIDSNNEEEPNQYYQQNEHAALKENYDSDMDGLSQPEDSNEHADSREADEENEHDMISKIRSKMSMKRMFR